MKAVDLFAGAGGFSEAARMAGCEVVWAANHWPLAVDVHKANHPGTDHECQDLQQADWTKVPSMDVLLASPACQGHSRAGSRGGDGRRGSAPAHDALRSTAWAVVSCAEVHRPPLVVVENVAEFQQWELYPIWCSALQALGYKFSVQVLDAADYGVPQHRKRLFVVASLKRQPDVMKAPQNPVHVGFRPFLDPTAGGWAPVSGKRPSVRARVEKGRRNFPTGMFVTQHVTGHPGRSLDRPLPTVTTKHQLGLVREGPNGDEARMLNVLEYRRAMGFRDDYELSDKVCESVKLLGNAVPPLLGKAVIEHAVTCASGVRVVA